MNIFFKIISKLFKRSSKKAIESTQFRATEEDYEGWLGI